MNIHQRFDQILRNACKKDRSKCQRILQRLSLDVDVLKNNYSEHLYKLYREFYVQKVFLEMYNFEDKSITTYLTNKCVTSLLKIKRICEKPKKKRNENNKNNK